MIFIILQVIILFYNLTIAIPQALKINKSHSQKEQEAATITLMLGYASSIMITISLVMHILGA